MIKLVKLNLNDIKKPPSLYERKKPFDEFLELYKASNIADDENNKTHVKLDKSPFEKQRDMTAPRGSENLQTQVSKDMFEDFMKFARNYNTEHPAPNKPQDTKNKSNPLKHIINDFLNSHALERKCFDEIYIIMAFNILDLNDETLNNDNVESAVIGYVESPYKFTNLEPFQAVDDKHNKSRIIQALKHFDKDTLTMLNLKSLNREVLFNIPNSIYNDFDVLCERLQMEHSKINFNDSYICMFNLNNYLDVLHDGVYVSKHSTHDHEGLVVLLDPDDIYKLKRICARITWSYTAGKLETENDGEDVGFFNENIIENAPQDVYDEYFSIFSGFVTPKAKLEMNLKTSNNRVDLLERELEAEKKRNAELQSKFDKLKNITDKIDDVESRGEVWESLKKD